jgi:hypothetical protein
VANELLNMVNKVNAAIRSDQIKRTALTTVLAIHKPRIFEKGQAEDGSKIGTYSKKYDERKKKLGRNPGFVNLRLSDQMQGDYTLIINGDNYGFGFQNDFNANKMSWNTDRFNKRIAALSESEMELLANVLTDLTFKAI